MPPRGSYGALLDALRGVTWPARRTIRGPAAGTHRSRQRGVSPEFTEYRPYRQGDDPRRLDWKLLARTDRAFLRITNDRATLGTMLLLDASASMAFPLATQGKWAQACRHRDRARGGRAQRRRSGGRRRSPGSTGVAQLPPRTRRGVIGEAARLFESIAPAGSASLDARALDSCVRRSAWCSISDFLGDDDTLLRAARERITAGADVLAIHIVAREELDPPRAAIIAHGSRARRSSSARSWRKRGRDIVEAFATWRAELARAWREAGAAFFEVPADEAADHAVRRIASPATLASAQARGA